MSTDDTSTTPGSPSYLLSPSSSTSYFDLPSFPPTRRISQIGWGEPDSPDRSFASPRFAGGECVATMAERKRAIRERLQAEFYTRPNESQASSQECLTKITTSESPEQHHGEEVTEQSRRRKRKGSFIKLVKKLVTAGTSPRHSSISIHLQSTAATSTREPLL
ncbi:hypothetical protein EJ05DRAFT_484964 [Pseudovirgaria hyperparasitica]|uniref:Uncharacterized protein n=1 Tax=Pseudovirgaria hyperparasitica TaxID=470096 RepID=A0A6A6W8J2_9PEZI|nr:uncharacterized protein EJ05DRAFT_484964 [Pseudovirgaria hyperparasitica]KAF2758865.1 hypothetical protein EJ05DRAFT_484964 [Pseudovirgaria hyperparasitica]